jgi:hypothetical protein
LRYDTGPEGGTSPARRRAARPLFAALAVVVCCVLAVFGWLVFGPRGRSTPQAHGSASASASTGGPAAGSTSAEPSGTNSVSAEPSGPPEGYSLDEDLYGFTAAIPEGWTRTAEPDTSGGAQVFFTPDNQNHLIEIGAVHDVTGTPYSTFQTLEAQLAARTGFQLHRFDHLDSDPNGPVEFEFSYQHATLGQRHVIDRGFFGPDGVFYAVLVAGPEDEWSKTLQTYQAVAGSVCATNYCGAGPSASSDAGR